MTDLPILEADAQAEGINQHGRFYRLLDDAELTAVAAYRRVWGQINGPASWDANPFVVKVSFTVERQNIDSCLAVNPKLAPLQ